MKGKEYGISLIEDNIHELLEMYLDINNEPEVAKELANLFQHQTTFQLFASPFLSVCDAEATTNLILPMFGGQRVGLTRTM